MTSLAFGDRIRIAFQNVGRSSRDAVLGMLSGPVSGWRSMRAGDVKLLFAPADMRTADPTIAADIYNGRYVFSGQAVETAGSPYTVSPPSQDWERELHSFRWLRHLRAAETEVARSNAQALTGDWLKSYSRPGGVAWQPDVTAQRILSHLSQSAMLLQGADHAYYMRFIRSLIRQAAYLKTGFAGIEPGLPRVRAAIAIAMVGLTVSKQDALMRAGLDRLDQELGAQILPDGGHISRNPAALIEVLVELLPLRQTLIARGQRPSGTMLGAIDRMMPMLRFFRHRDGSFVHFNGMSSSSTDIVATVLAYDETMGTPVASAVYSGYERLEAAESVVIIDTGPPPPLRISQQAHAGTLSFEFSSGRHRIVINCGAPAARHHAVRRASRQTNAHSTAIINNTSSGRFVSVEADAPLLPGPRSVPLERRTLEDGSVHIEMAHDGYLRQFGLVHERDLTLAADGDSLFGTDRISGTPVQPENSFTLRFHLDPTVRLIVTEDENSLDLELPDGSIWRFQANAQVTWDESVCLSDVYGSRSTSQIVISGPVERETEVEWQLYRAN